MKRILATAGIAGIALIGVTAPASAGDKDNDKKISICHATGSESNPYVHITVSENAGNGNGGHASHAGDLIPAPVSGCPGGSKGGHDKDDDDGHGSKKITICHATGSEKNPYVVITIPEKAWWNGHKDGHNGRADIYPVPAGGCDVKHEEEEEEETKPPVVVPPVVVPPVVTPPVVTPPVVVRPVVVPPARGTACCDSAGCCRSSGRSRSCAGSSQPRFQRPDGSRSPDDSGTPAWFGGLAALLGATGLVALRHRGRLQDFQATK